MYSIGHPCGLGALVQYTEYSSTVSQLVARDSQGTPDDVQLCGQISITCSVHSGFGGIHGVSSGPRVTSQIGRCP